VCVCVVTVETNKVSLLTDAAVVGCKPTVPRGYLVGGEDIRGKGVTRVLQIIVETLVHLVVVPNEASRCASCNETRNYYRTKSNFQVQTLRLKRNA